MLTAESPSTCSGYGSRLARLKRLGAIRCRDWWMGVEMGFWSPVSRWNLSLRLRFGGDFGVAGCSFRQILTERSFGITDCPADTAAKKIQEERIRPVCRAVTDGGVEHTALILHSRPSHGIRRTLVGFSRHSFGVQC